MKKRTFGFCRNTFLISILYVVSQICIAQTVSHLDTTFGQGTFNSYVQAMALQSDGKVVVGGLFTYYKTTPVNHLVRLNKDGTFDKSFHLADKSDFNVTALSIQPDGKIIVGRKKSTNDGYSLMRLNEDGSLDNTFNAINDKDSEVTSIALQEDGKIIVTGGIYNLYTKTIYTVIRLNQDGTIDNTFILTADNSSERYLSCAVDPQGKIIAAGRKMRRFNSDGSLDNTFDVSGGGPTVSNNVPTIYDVSLQSDGKIIIAGDFHKYNGIEKHTIARLNSDGTVDNSFSGNTKNTSQYIMATDIQPDGKIIIAGNFFEYNGTQVKQIARLNTDGSLDTEFNKGIEETDQYVACILIQPDSKIIIGGALLSYDGITSNSIARLHADGSLDRSFNVCSGLDSTPGLMALQPDGKILMVGGYHYYNKRFSPFAKGINRRNADGSPDESFNADICEILRINLFALLPSGKILVAGVILGSGGKYAIYRLNEDGTTDDSFKPMLNIQAVTATNDAIKSIGIQADGKIVVAGYFQNINGAVFKNLVRLNPDGSEDNTFNQGTGINTTVNNVIIQPDQKILLTGPFTSFNGTSGRYIVRLNPDGTMDKSFATPGTGLSYVPLTTTLQPDGKIILAGNRYLNSFNGVPKNLILRLNPDGTLDTGFDFNLVFETSSQINVCLVQPDGKIIIAGALSFGLGIQDYRTYRLNADGSVDDIFPGLGLDGMVSSGLLQENGGIILAGRFWTYKKMTYNNIIRLIGDPTYYNAIRGNIFTDTNNDCKQQVSEKTYASLVVKATPGPYYGNTDRNGNYQIRVDSGNVSYTLTQQLNAVNSKLFMNQCEPSHVVALKGASKDTASFDFANDLKECILTNINIQHTSLTRCMKSMAYIEYCNAGNTEINDAKIKVEYPEFLEPISSIPMWTSRKGSVLIYDIGLIEKTYCGKIAIIDSVICDRMEILGLTQCVKASIYPKSTCTAQNTQWDLSSTEVTGTCKNNQAAFVIANTGEGNMTDSLGYRIFVNDTLVYTDKYKLLNGYKLDVSYPSQGQTIRLEADQQIYHPGNSRPRAIVEGCGISSTGLIYNRLVTTSPLDDLDDEVALVCYPIRGSYDPNDKQASPTGVGLKNQVLPGTELEYTIRFQNTGTAPAYTVKVVDTLDASLDIMSLAEGVSSHPYTLKVTGKGQAVLTFAFNNINLPDSTENKLGSNGLVSFRITIPADSPLGTKIYNKAYIYFDYNDPIITNETMHTVGITIAENLSKGSKVTVGNVTTGLLQSKYNNNAKIYPNPSGGMVTVEIPELGDHMELRVTSMVGVLQKTIKLNKTNIQQVHLEGIHQGMYIYEIWKDGERMYVSTLQIW